MTTLLLAALAGAVIGITARCISERSINLPVIYGWTDDNPESDQ